MAEQHLASSLPEAAADDDDDDDDAGVGADTGTPLVALFAGAAPVRDDDEADRAADCCVCAGRALEPMTTDCRPPPPEADDDDDDDDDAVPIDNVAELIGGAIVRLGSLMDVPVKL